MEEGDLTLEVLLLLRGGDTTIDIEELVLDLFVPREGLFDVGEEITSMTTGVNHMSNVSCFSPTPEGNTVDFILLGDGGRLEVA